MATESVSVFSRGLTRTSHQMRSNGCRAKKIDQGPGEDQRDHGAFPPKTGSQGGRPLRGRLASLGAAPEPGNEGRALDGGDTSLTARDGVRPRCWSRRGASATHLAPKRDQSTSCRPGARATKESGQRPLCMGCCVLLRLHTGNEPACCRKPCRCTCWSGPGHGTSGIGSAGRHLL